VALYSVVGPYRILLGLQKTCNPKNSRTKEINFLKSLKESYHHFQPINESNLLTSLQHGSQYTIDKRKHDETKIKFKPNFSSLHICCAIDLNFFPLLLLNHVLLL
jgi:hypothetical protein